MRKYCGNCATPLTGKQKLWCSPACSNDAWQREHAEERAAYFRARRADKPAPTIEGRLRLRIAELEAEVASLRKEQNR